MSVATYLLHRLGLLRGPGWPAFGFKPELVALFRHSGFVSSKRWNSESSAGEYQRKEFARKVLAESYARLPVAK